MKNFVIQAGLFHTFDAMYDPRSRQTCELGDYPAFEVIGRPGTVHRTPQERARSAPQELRFLSTFLSTLNLGRKTVMGVRDIDPNKMTDLDRRFAEQMGPSKVDLRYGITEDRLLVGTVPDPADAIEILSPVWPPLSGEAFFCLTRSPFGILEMYWRRAAVGSIKADDRRFRRDALGQAAWADVTVYQDREGSYVILAHPMGPTPDAVEDALTCAAQEAGMDCAFAPSLFA